MRQRRRVASPMFRSSSPSSSAMGTSKQLYAEFSAELARLGQDRRVPVRGRRPASADALPRCATCRREAERSVVIVLLGGPFGESAALTLGAGAGARRAHRHPRLLLPGGAERPRRRLRGAGRGRRPGGRPALPAHRLRLQPPAVAAVPPHRPAAHRHRLPRHQLRLQGDEAGGWRASSTSTAACTASSRSWRSTAASPCARCACPSATRTAAPAIYGTGAYLGRLLDILTVFFLTKFTRTPLRFFGLLGIGALRRWDS